MPSKHRREALHLQTKRIDRLVFERHAVEVSDAAAAGGQIATDRTIVAAAKPVCA